MKKVFAIADNILSPLGLNSQSNWEALMQSKTGVEKINRNDFQLKDFYASLLSDDQLNLLEGSDALKSLTKLERMFVYSIGDAAKQCDIDLASKRTLFVFSTTKGNIDLLDGTSAVKSDRVKLSAMAQKVTSYFKNINEPIVVSNACISGVLGIITGSFFIREGLYDHIVVSGGDIISEFTVSGFQCLFALSRGYCKPFDKNRDGINLGEGCATIILSSKKQNMDDVEIKGGASSNDANHISGPSKTGDGLFIAIRNALRYSKVNGEDVGFISAHGTATAYNDEMEAKALNLASLSSVPANSLKGYFGHTLGAAGVLETVVSMWSLKKQMLVSSRGYSEHGVSLPLRLIDKNRSENIKYCLKTASGFGGCNAALILSYNE